MKNFGLPMRTFGATDAEKGNKSAPVQDALPAILKTAQGVLASDDAYESVELIQAKIANLKKMKLRVPALAWFYDNEIAKLKARLTAAQRNVGLQMEGESATREWRFIGYAVGAAAVLVGISAAARLLRRD